MINIVEEKIKYRGNSTSHGKNKEPYDYDSQSVRTSYPLLPKHGLPSKSSAVLLKEAF